ncbi:hypothetical protein [Desulfonatronum parangueonense]
MKHFNRGTHPVFFPARNMRLLTGRLCSSRFAVRSSTARIRVTGVRRSDPGYLPTVTSRDLCETFSQKQPNS